MTIRLGNRVLFFGRPVPPVEPRHNLAEFDFSMTEDMWRDSGNHLGWMRAQLNSQYGKQLMGVLWNSSPQRKSLSHNPTDVQANIELGRVNGYNEAVELICRLVVPLTVREELEADYGAEEILKELNYPPRK